MCEIHWVHNLNLWRVFEDKESCYCHQTTTAETIMIGFQVWKQRHGVAGCRVGEEFLDGGRTGDPYVRRKSLTRASQVCTSGEKTYCKGWGFTQDKGRNVRGGLQQLSVVLLSGSIGLGCPPSLSDLLTHWAAGHSFRLFQQYQVSVPYDKQNRFYWITLNHPTPNILYRHWQ